MKDANFSECKFSAEMVSYMYGELSPAERSSFEQHLVECSECTDEFAAISSARYEVYDWKKLEFDPLETPWFEIPVGQATVVSWSDKIRAVFVQGWAVPTVSFAALAIFAVVAAGLIWRSGNSVDFAQKSPDLKTVTVPVKDEGAAPVPSVNGENDRKRAIAVEPTVTQAATSKRATPKPSAQPVRAARVRPIEAKQTTARNAQRPVPTLNDYPDDEDTSLRLAELLEDIGSR